MDYLSFINLLTSARRLAYRNISILQKSLQTEALKYH